MITTREVTNPKPPFADSPQWQQVIWEELGGYRWRLVLVQSLLKLFPEHVGSRIRDGLLRRVGYNIGDRVWLGARCTALPGITIADGAVVASGANLSNDVPTNGIVAGAPARVIRYIDSETHEPFNVPS